MASAESTSRRNSRRALVGSALAGTATGAVLLWLVVRRIDVDTALAAIGNANLWFVLLGLTVAVSMWFFKALRWTAILRGTIDLDPADSVRAVMIGGAGNLLISHVGELARVYLASKTSNARPETLLGSLAVERFFDFAAIFAIVGAVVFFGDTGEPRRSHPEYLVGAIALAILVTLALLMLAGNRTQSLIDSPDEDAIGRMRSRAAQLIGGVLDGLKMLVNGRQILVVLVWSMTMWVACVLSIYCCLRAVTASVEPWHAALVLAVHTIALLLPAPPGRVGTVQASFAVALVPLGFVETDVFAASVIYNCLMTVPVLLMGAMLWRPERSGTKSARAGTDSSMKN